MGTILSFILNKIFTFNKMKNTRAQILKFILLAIVAYFLAVIIVSFLVFLYKQLNITFVNLKTAERIAQVIAIGITTIYNFLAMKYFSFKD
jgi:putative flippase GtrA